MSQAQNSEQFKRTIRRKLRARLLAHGYTPEQFSAVMRVTFYIRAYRALLSPAEVHLQEIAAKDAVAALELGRVMMGEELFAEIYGADLNIGAIFL